MDDVVAVYRELLKTYKPHSIGIFGTSAGAILTCEVAVRLKQLGFDQDLIERMQDFREAYLDANESTILAEALRAFIESQTANNQDIGRRYGDARKRRGKD